MTNDSFAVLPDISFATEVMFLKWQECIFNII